MANTNTNTLQPKLSFTHSWARFNVQLGFRFIVTIMLIGGITGFVSLFVPGIRNFLMPRFGWIGLILVWNPLIFLFPWMKKPKIAKLRAASFLCGIIGTLNGLELIRTGTVEVVQNPFLERLHSAWIWSVLSYLLMAFYLVVTAKIELKRVAK
jgi:hypothetical protein